MRRPDVCGIAGTDCCCYRQTKEGSGHAKKEDGTERRYLPKKAWERMSEKEKEETERKKVEGSREGKQFVGNTPKVGRAQGWR